ncbi:23855_t:CDS:1 [Dentiscutata erythropus]|uniref:23855_t:CDS:1 n=1 Tax=Dentiscutata erythropus TaxID=1348616 RepID=A0A9N8WML0_9GLOM|nr:23855_t:CDS:1 [Dentiscutata erythropus]
MESSRYQNITHSFYEEFLRIRPPYELTIKRDELISPSINSRSALNHNKDPEKYKKPRPLNSFMLFRKNYQAELKSLGVNIKNGEFLSLASKIWEEQPYPVKNYFEIAAKAADEIHKGKNPSYRYSSKKNRKKIKSNKISKKANNTKVEINRSPFPNYDQRPDVDIPPERSNNHLNGDSNEDEIFSQMLIELTYAPLDKS